jgi:2-hydroxy-6-oxonona-2,4-dienedioate hydrolase
VLWTSDDPSGPAAEGRQIQARIPGATFALIEGAGHWPQWEQTEKFNNHHIEFLGGTSQERHAL